MSNELTLQSPIEPPTVLHVIPALRAAGAEHMLAALVSAKRAVPHRQVVVDLSGNGELAGRIRAAAVPLHELGLSGVAGIPSTVLRLASLIRRLKPAAIQSWLYYADLISLWALGLSGRRSKTRLYWSVRNSDLDLARYSRTLRWTIACCRRLSVKPDAVVANSYAGRSAHERLGYRPRSFPVIPNGIDTARFKPDRALRDKTRAELGIELDTPVVIHVARADPMKDHAMLLAVAARMTDLRFLMVGEGTQELAAPANVAALGARSDMPALFAAADVALSTSRSEGFPNVIAESMSSGLPTVATDVGDSARIIGVTGFTVPPQDVAGAEAAIKRLLSETRDARGQRSRACRQRIEANFSLDRAVAAFDALLLRGVLPEFPRP